MNEKTQDQGVERSEFVDSAEIENETADEKGYASAEIQQSTQILDSPEGLQRKRAYMRKLDFIILPTISALYFFEYLDRGNIAVRNETNGNLQRVH